MDTPIHGSLKKKTVCSNKTKEVRDLYNENAKISEEIKTPENGKTSHVHRAVELLL